MDTNIAAHEIAQAWPKLSREVQQAVYIAILEGRLAARELENESLRHQIGVLEEAVKMPEGFTRAPNNEVADAARTVINEV